MDNVLDYILEKKTQYEGLPFFVFLNDSDYSVRQRLSFLPHMGFFVMAFSDLNKFVLRDDTSDDDYQKKVNAHTYEDESHWPWFLEDLHALGHNKKMEEGAWLQQLWSDESQAGRQLIYRLVGLVSRMSGLEKMVVIEAIEETGNVFLNAVVPLANAFQRETGKELRYCGAHHLARESGHAQRQDGAELTHIALSDEVKQRCFTHVDTVFRWFETWTGEMLANAKR